MSDPTATIPNPTLSSTNINWWKYAFYWLALLVAYFSLDQPYNEYVFLFAFVAFVFYLVYKTVVLQEPTLFKSLLIKSPPPPDEKELPADEIQVELVPLSWVDSARIVASVMLLGAGLSAVAWLIRMQTEPQISMTVRTSDIERRMKSFWA
jgi:exosortase/archaeosortase